MFAFSVSDIEAPTWSEAALANELTGLFTDKGDEITSDVKTRVQKIRDGINETISQTATKGRELTQAANVDGLGETLENTIRERPFMMMAIAAGLGAIVASQLRR